MWVAPLKKMPNLLCQSQTAYSAIDSFAVCWIGWLNLKKQDILAIKQFVHFTNRSLSSVRKNHTQPQQPGTSSLCCQQPGHTLLWDGIPFFNQNLSQISQICTGCQNLIHSKPAWQQMIASVAWQRTIASNDVKGSWTFANLQARSHKVKKEVLSSDPLSVLCYFVLDLL